MSHRAHESHVQHMHARCPLEPVRAERESAHSERRASTERAQSKHRASAEQAQSERRASTECNSTVYAHRACRRVLSRDQKPFWVVRRFQSVDNCG